VMTEQVPPPRRAGTLGPALRAVLVHDPAARPGGEQFDRMLAAAEHGAAGPLTPAGPAFPAPHTPADAFPAQHGGPQAPRYQQPYPAYQPSEPVTRPPAARGRVVAVVASYSVSAVVVIVAVVFLLNSFRGVEDPSKTGTGSHGTTGVTVPNVDGRPTTTAPGAAEDLLTPAGARKAVSALSGVMGGSKVSDFTLYADSASATAPAKGVKNGFDDFVYRDGTASRTRPDTVDADRAVLDLNTVNWDALPALWERANKELGVDRPTTRYVVVDTDIIDGTPSLKLYVSDDYGAGYLAADLAGNVTDLYPRG
jgi:hypothetical protein